MQNIRMNNDNSEKSIDTYQLSLLFGAFNAVVMALAVVYYGRDLPAFTLDRVAAILRNPAANIIMVAALLGPAFILAFIYKHYRQNGNKSLASGIIIAFYVIFFMVIGRLLRINFS